MNIILSAVPAHRAGVYALECSECGLLGTYSGSNAGLTAYACEHLHTHGMDVTAQWT